MAPKARRASHSSGQASGLTLGFSLLLGCSTNIGGSNENAHGSGATGAGGSSSGAGGAAAGTTGATSGTGGSSAMGGTAGTSSGGGGTGGTPNDCSGLPPNAPAFHARLLSPSQYNHSVQDLVAVAGEPANRFAAGAAVQLDDAAVELRANAASEIARQAASTLSGWAPCSPPAVPQATCRDQIVERIGARAYRHALSETEKTELTALFDAGTAEKDFATGVEWFLTGALQAPDFLYEFVRIAADEAPGEIRPLSGDEIASRLSFFLWDSIPDETLHTAAASGELLAPAGVQANAERMLGDARFERGIQAFYTSWLRLAGFRDLARDDAGFTTDVVNSLKLSLLTGVTELYSSPDPNVASLFSGEAYYLNSTLRTFYGLPDVGGDFTPTAMSGEGRRGVLTHPGLMALFARPAETNPISRGLFALRSLLCLDVPPPPEGVPIPQLPAETPTTSTRDRLEQHVTDDLCLGCHSQFDPLGYAFESFDEVGRHRTSDGGKPIDSSGVIEAALDLDGAFANGGELFERIAASAHVKQCFAERYFEFALSRLKSTEDACSLEAVQAAFVPSGDLKRLAVLVASSDALRYRLSEGAAQ